MNSIAIAPHDSAALVACTVSRDIQHFDFLIEDMEAALGERWGDLGFAEAASFLKQSDAAAMSFVAVALTHEDEDDIDLVASVIARAKSCGVKVILIAEDLGPAILHRLLREGGDEFVPYPLPENALAEAIERVMTPPAEAVALEVVEDNPRLPKSDGKNEGVLIATHGMAGGVGATTVAVNLAWELANVNKKGDQPSVCLIDLDFQFGTAATYLDLPRKESVFELLSDVANMDGTAFMQALGSFDGKLHVMTAPADMIPLDLIGPDEVASILETARTNFDYVVIDMPSVMVEWSQTVLEAAHVYLALLELDMRCAQNLLRVKRILQSEDLPFDKLRFALNRAPGMTDLSGKARVKRLAESLGISVEVLLPNGGKQVVQSCDHGTPMAVSAKKNPLRREIEKLAASIHAVNQADAAAAS